MRTTMTIDDSLMRELKKTAHEQGLPLKEVVNVALRAGLRAMQAPQQGPPYRTPTFKMGYPRGGLSKALQLVDDLENEAVAGEMAVRK